MVSDKSLKTDIAPIVKTATAWIVNSVNDYQQQEAA
jgi:hypothetical protein